MIIFIKKIGKLFSIVNFDTEFLNIYGKMFLK